jgi:hypothetical protein
LGGLISQQAWCVSLRAFFFIGLQLLKGYGGQNAFKRSLMELPRELEGRYINYFELVHTRDEFLISFGQVLPGEAAPNCQIRLVTGPPYAQVLWQLLGESLDRYREEFGEIRPPEGR